MIVSQRREHIRGLLLSFAEFPDVEAVENFRNLPLFVLAADRPPLPQGEFYQHQLLGLQVFKESGGLLGTLVEILHTGGNDVFVVHSASGGEILLPAIDQVIRQVLPEEGRVVVHLLPGLLETGKP